MVQQTVVASSYNEVGAKEKTPKHRNQLEATADHKQVKMKNAEKQGTKVSVSKSMVVEDYEIELVAGWPAILNRRDRPGHGQDVDTESNVTMTARHQHQHRGTGPASKR